MITPVARGVVALMLILPLRCAAQARTLDDAFRPISADFPKEIAMICVKYGADRSPVSVLVDGKADDPALNAQMLALLRTSGRQLPSQVPLDKEWHVEAVDRAGGFAGATVPEDPFRCPN